MIESSTAIVCNAFIAHLNETKSGGDVMRAAPVKGT